MTINQRRWTYVSVISAMLLFGYLLPGNNNDRIRTYAAMSAGACCHCTDAEVQPPALGTPGAFFL